MILDFASQSTLVKYRLLNNTLTPRPITLAVSVNANGVINIAPFSFLGVVSSNPIVFSLCLSPKSDGMPKDTFQNAISTKKLTLNLPNQDFVECIQKTSQELESNLSEASVFHSPIEALYPSYPPILKGIDTAYFCDLLEVLEFGTYDKTLLLQAKACYIDDEIYTQDLSFTPWHLGRVGKFFVCKNQVIESSHNKK